MRRAAVPLSVLHLLVPAAAAAPAENDVSAALLRRLVDDRLSVREIIAPTKNLTAPDATLLAGRVASASGGVNWLRGRSTGQYSRRSSVGGGEESARK